MKYTDTGLSFIDPVELIYCNHWDNEWIGLTYFSKETSTL